MRAIKTLKYYLGYRSNSISICNQGKLASLFLCQIFLLSESNYEWYFFIGFIMKGFINLYFIAKVVLLQKFPSRKPSKKYRQWLIYINSIFKHKIYSLNN